MVELTNKTDNTIPVRELKDGQIGVITEWNGKEYRGEVIQIYGSQIITLGSGVDGGWNTIPQNDSCRVRVLASGETLTIKNNQ